MSLTCHFNPVVKGSGERREGEREREGGRGEREREREREQDTKRTTPHCANKLQYINLFIFSNINVNFLVISVKSLYWLFASRVGGR